MSKRSIFTPIPFALSRYVARSVDESHGSCQPEDEPKRLYDPAGVDVDVAALTTALWALVAFPEPAVLVAVTTTRSV
jgi:hypothetical protein